MAKAVVPTPKIGVPPKFDPYYKWLGIPVEEQPPTFYRLLGVPPFTADNEVLENTAQQRQMFLLTLQRGQHEDAAKRLFDEVSAAKQCLTNPAERDRYDRELKKVVPAPAPAPAPLPGAAARPGALPTTAKAKRVWKDEPEPLPTATPLTPPSPVGGPIDSPNAHAVTGKVRAPSSGNKEAIIYFGGIIVSGFIGLALGYLVITSIDLKYDFLHLYAKVPAADPSPPPRVPEPKLEEIKPDDPPLVIQKPLPKPPEPPKVVTPKPVDPAPPTPMPKPPEPPPSEPAQPEVSPEEKKIKQAELQIKEAMERGDLRTALSATETKAKLENANPVKAKMELLTAAEKDDRIQPATVASSLAALLEDAVAQKEFAVAAPQVDKLLVLARKLDDRELLRRATLIALKVRQGAE